MALPPLKVRIGADTDALSKGLGRANRVVKGFAIAASAAFVGVSAALSTMTVKGLAAVDSQAKLARSMDATVNGLRAVQLAGGDAGVSLGELNTAAQQMNRELARAAAGTGPAAEALGKLGLRARDLQDLDIDKRLALIADRTKALGLSAGQTSDIMRDLGVRSRNMALLLTQGGDAIRAAREEVREFGLELSDAQVAGVERANDAVSRMRLIFEGLAQQLAANVAPAMESVAVRFSEFSKSDAAREAISRIADAFGRLAEIVTSGDFLGVAASGIETLAGLMAGAAEAAVLFSDNIELVTAAMGGLAIAIAAMGGPLTIIVGLIGGAAFGMASLLKSGKKGAEGLDKAKRASDALNRALGTFADEASPAAAREARDLARANLDIKKSALQAARAELAKADAIAESDRRVGNVSGGPDAVDVRREQVRARVAEIEAEIGELERLDEALSEKARIGGVRPRARPIDSGDDDDDILGNGLSVKDQMQSRLDALLQGLQTEQEALTAWRENSLETLREAREAELITEEEFRLRKEQIEKEHQDRMSELQRRESAARLDSIQGALGNLASLMRTENDKLFKIGKAAAIANATISGYEAAVHAWDKGMAIGGPPVAAAFTAASLARTGALISSIASQSPRGSGSGGGGAGAASGASAAQQPATQVNVTLPSQGPVSVGSVRALIEQINEAIDDGAVLRGITVQ